MAPAVIAGLVREQSPDHATHTQDFLATVGSTPEADTIEVRCNCRPGVSVGLTLRVPRTPPPVAAEPVKHAPKKEGGHGA